MRRAKFSYKQRQYIENALDNGLSDMEICKEFGITTHQLEMEIQRGWISKEGKYSANKAQRSLR